MHMYVLFINSYSVGSVQKMSLGPSLLLYMCTEVIILVARWQPHPNVAMVRGSVRWG